jgi:hypothetical protein
MKRCLGLVAAVFAAFLLMAPVTLAAEPSLGHTGRVVVSTSGDVVIPAGEHADLVFVVDGTARVAGEVNTLLVIDGRAQLTGATVETVIAVQSPVDVGPGTHVLGDVMALDAAVARDPSAQVGGSVRDLGPELAALAMFLAPAAFLLYLGFAIAAVVAALLAAGLASRQVRAAERLMREQPLAVIAAGLIGIVAPLLLAVVLGITIIGAPLAVALVFGLWPLAAFAGYLVAGIAIGDWVLARTGSGVVRERPYLAAVVGILVLEILTVVPFIGAIATFYGFGAVILLAWRILRSDSAGSTATVGPRTQAPASM